jgi:hypothetical protein
MTDERRGATRGFEVAALTPATPRRESCMACMVVGGGRVGKSSCDTRKKGREFLL